MIRAIRAAVGPTPLISVDTFFASVAAGAMRAGANMVNDVTGGKGDGEGMATFLAQCYSEGGCVPYVLMHSRGSTLEGGVGVSGGSTTLSGQEDKLPADFPKEGGTCQATVEGTVRDWLEENALEMCRGKVCMPRWDMILDPGLGFSKTPQQSRALLRRGRLNGGLPLGYATLYGPSRKGFLVCSGGGGRGSEEPKQRIWGTAAAVTAAVVGGADIVRVHDVEEMVKVCATADSIFRTSPI